MIATLPLFRPLNNKLISLLSHLEKPDWNKKTVAREWTVKDVAAHLLDTSLRAISLYRDQFETAPETKVSNYGELVSMLNQMNGDWVKAFKRLSPELLIEFHASTHETFIVCLEKLDPFAPARFSVAWAGEEISTNWFHIAREYTERWHHQQQIREAIEQPGILTHEFYHPVLDTFMLALPHHYSKTNAPVGTRVEIRIETDAGGVWFIERGIDKWIVGKSPGKESQVKIIIPVDLSWKLFTKAVSYTEIKSFVRVSGDIRLAFPALEMLPVMAVR